MSMILVAVQAPKPGTSRIRFSMGAYVVSCPNQYLSQASGDLVLRYSSVRTALAALK